MNQEIKNEFTPEESAAAAEQETVAVEPTVIAETEAEAAAEPKKKKSKAGKVVLTVVIAVVALVLLVAIAAGIIGLVIFNKATSDVEIPEKSESATTATFAIDAVLGLMTDDQIVVDNAAAQMLFDKVTPSVAASLEGTPVELKDLYCVFEGDKGTIYGQLYLSQVDVKGFKINVNKTVTFSAGFDVNYENPYIVAQINSINVGTLSIPMDLISTFTGGITLPDGLKIEGDKIYYDVSGLDTMIDEAIPKALSEGLGDGVIASYLSEKLAESTDVEITNADIVDGKLIIEGHIF